MHAALARLHIAAELLHIIAARLCQQKVVAKVVDLHAALPLKILRCYCAIITSVLEAA